VKKVQLIFEILPVYTGNQQHKELLNKQISYSVHRMQSQIICTYPEKKLKQNAHKTKKSPVN